MRKDSPNEMKAVIQAVNDKVSKRVIFYLFYTLFIIGEMEEFGRISPRMRYMLDVIADLKTSKQRIVQKPPVRLMFSFFYPPVWTLNFEGRQLCQLARCCIHKELVPAAIQVNRS